ncbi:MAG TPA: hypothetical protein VM529_13720, partial [Gemmata sp.]|nr:hypothetical protein [Gemmata sp.]
MIFHFLRERWMAVGVDKRLVLVILRRSNGVDRTTHPVFILLAVSECLDHPEQGRKRCPTRERFDKSATGYAREARLAVGRASDVEQPVK